MTQHLSLLPLLAPEYLQDTLSWSRADGKVSPGDRWVTPSPGTPSMGGVCLPPHLSWPWLRLAMAKGIHAERQEVSRAWERACVTGLPPDC